MEKIMSIDAETNGLWGNPFAIAAILYDEKGSEIDKIIIRIPNNYVTNPWVIENVLPTLEKIEITNNSYEEMLKSFADWYMANKGDTTVLYHMGHIVESHLFREMHRLGYIGDWDAPYTPIEVSEILRMKGEKPDSVDMYIKKYNIEVAEYGNTHNPLYDCEVAYKAYRHLTSK